jgi:hypothetical protein
VGLALADIVHQYGPTYRQKYADRLLPSHRQAMRAIEQCRTEALGGQVYTCPECGEVQYSYHSCRNRHCPKCQNDKAQEWLEAQQPEPVVQSSLSGFCDCHSVPRQKLRQSQQMQCLAKIMLP